MKKYALILAVTTIFLNGCATSPVSDIDSRNTTSSINEKFLKKEKNSSQLIIKRDSGFMGSACSYKVLINNEYVVSLNGGEKVTLFLTSGNYIITTTANGICGGGVASVETVLSPNKNKSYRISSGQDGTIQIQPSSF